MEKGLSGLRASLTCSTAQCRRYLRHFPQKPNRVVPAWTDTAASAVFDPTPASRMRYAVRDEPCMTRLTTMAAMPARTALAIGDDSMSVIGLDPDACS